MRKPKRIPSDTFETRYYGIHVFRQLAENKTWQYWLITDRGDERYCGKDYPSDEKIDYFRDEQVK